MADTARVETVRDDTGGVTAAVMALSLDAVVATTRQGIITGWNPFAAGLYGYRAEEIIGQASSVLLPAGWESEESDLLSRAVAGERVAPFTTYRVRKDGAIMTVLLTMSPIVTTAGEVVGAMSIARLLPASSPDAADQHAPHQDRERLRAQLEQAQRLEALGQLAGGVAHDFNNLIGVILNYAEFVGEEVEAAARADTDPRWQAACGDVAQIRRAAERAAGLTRQLLSFARREVIQPRVICFNDVLNDVTATLRHTLGAGVELVLNLGEELPPVLADPGQLEQIILNLSVNARDAMPGGGRLTIKTDTFHVDRAYAAEWSSVLPGDYVRVRVTDTGAGMPPEVIKHAFEPFFTTKGKGEGSGMGLATVYGAVTQAEGHVRVHSVPGRCSTFTILLPVTAQAATSPAPVQHGPRRTTGVTVLVVEDEDALREVTRRLLTRQGYSVITAADGAEAVTAAAGHQGAIDLLITDVIMPRMLGREAAEKIRRDRPDIRVLYMSGYAQPFLAARGRLDPDVTLLDKPFTEPELLAKIDIALTRQVAVSLA